MRKNLSYLQVKLFQLSKVKYPTTSDIHLGYSTMQNHNTSTKAFFYKIQTQLGYSSHFIPYIF